MNWPLVSNAMLMCRSSDSFTLPELFGCIVFACACLVCVFVPDTNTVNRVIYRIYRSIAGEKRCREAENRYKQSKYTIAHENALQHMFIRTDLSILKNDVCTLRALYGQKGANATVNDQPPNARAYL